MSRTIRSGPRLLLAAFPVALLAGLGCQSLPQPRQHAPAQPGAVRQAVASHKQPLVQPEESCPELNLPKELNKVSLPAYMVEPPDILIINATRVIPLPPYLVQPLDQVYVVVANTLALAGPQQINGIYGVDPDGTINLGPGYGGQLRVIDMTTEQITTAVAKKVAPQLTDVPKVSVSLAQSRGQQIIQGEHIVNPDGVVNLGTYGSVYVAGMTLPQIKAQIEAHLSKFLLKPEVSVDVLSYNSKYYYVITDFAGNGTQVAKLPVTGNETVLDAIANIGGLSAVSSNRMWIARPAPAGTEDQILPVDFKGITRRGHTRTNYQILPGDRVFVMGNPATKFDTLLGRTTAPFERAAGTSLLGFTTFKTFETSGNFLNGGNNR
jgi:protein involved in polysaccharide export with SLBB domain